MLTKSQERAVKEISFPLIVIAGPGCGKTNVITKKIEYLIKEKQYTPESILSLTFTQKAAEEMSKRVESLLVDKNDSSGEVSPMSKRVESLLVDRDSLTASKKTTYNAQTFHSFGLQLLEEYGSKLKEFPQDYSLIDESFQLLYFYEHLKDFTFKSIESKIDNLSLAKECLAIISKLKDYGYSLDTLESLETNIHTKLDIFSFYTKYEQYKKKNNYIDFGDIILYVKKLLSINSIKKNIKEKYKYILVDEFQDTNKTQLDIITTLADSNITIVGDKKQSIYGFRGANYSNLKIFKEYFKGAKEIYLTENFRSSQKIINSVNTIISSISSSQEMLKSNHTSDGVVSLIKATNEFSELGFLVESIQDLLYDTPNLTIGVLTRRKIELKNISKALQLSGIQHSAPGLYSFKDSSLLKELFNVLHVLQDPYENSIRLFSLLEDLGIRSETLRTLSRASNLNEKSLYQVLKQKKEYSNYKEEQESILNLYQILSHLLELKSSKLFLSSYILKVITKFNLYGKALKSENNFELDYLNQFLKYLESSFSDSHIDDLSLLLSIATHNFFPTSSAEDPTTVSQVTLLTLHNSKGKEFDIVFMPSLNDKKLPTSYKKSFFETSLDNSKEDFIDEEKRLFFVGISRAKQKLYLSYVDQFSKNKLPSKPSSFLQDLELTETLYNREFHNSLLKQNDLLHTLEKEVSQAIFSNQFSKAKLLIDTYSSSLQTQKSLSSFMQSNQKVQTKTNQKTQTKKLVDPNKMVYSVSQLKTYEQCPKKYLYQYIYKIPVTSKHYFDFGTSMHSVLEEIQPLAKSLNKKELILKGLSELSKQWISKSYIDAKQEKEYYEKGIEIIKKFVEKEYELFSNSKTVSLEKKFEFRIEGKKVLGFIDRIEKVDGTLFILDYKTSNSKELKSKLKENIQLYVYALALKKENLEPKKMGLWYLIHNEIDSVEFDEKVLEKIKKAILVLISQIESENFLPSPSHFNCTYCDFNTICEDKFSK